MSFRNLDEKRAARGHDLRVDLEDVLFPEDL